MYDPAWSQAVQSAAADRGQAVNILQLAKNRAVQHLLLHEIQKKPIYIEAATIVNHTQITGSVLTSDLTTDPTSISFEGKL
jgi:hypothetical protein